MIRKMQLAFGAAMLALLVVGVISYRGIVLSSESCESVRHTDDVLENLQDLLMSMRGIESSYRGFALTGSEKYVESFHAGILRSQQDQTTLRNLTADNPTQQRRIPTLDRLANQKITLGETVIGLRRMKGMEAAAAGAPANRAIQFIRIHFERDGFVVRYDAAILAHEEASALGNRLTILVRRDD
jgi:hypothetical protein